MAVSVLRRRKSLNLNPLELDDDNGFDESALEREPSMMKTVDEDEPSRSQRGGKRLPVVSFFLGLYRVYIYQNIRSTLDLLRDEEQWAAIKDFFGTLRNSLSRRAVRLHIAPSLTFPRAPSPQTSSLEWGIHHACRSSR